jgi:hypothetical protein
VVVVVEVVASLVLVFLIKATPEQLELPTVRTVKVRAVATEPGVVEVVVGKMVVLAA